MVQIALDKMTDICDNVYTMNDERVKMTQNEACVVLENTLVQLTPVMQALNADQCEVLINALMSINHLLADVERSALA